MMKRNNFSKITYTDKGIDLRRQINQELLQDQEVNRYGVFNSKKNSNPFFEERQFQNYRIGQGVNQVLGSIHQENIGQSIDRSGAAMQMFREYENQIHTSLRTQEEIKEFLLPNVDPEKLTPYIRRKLEAVSSQIVNSSSVTNKTKKSPWRKKLGSSYPSIFMKSTQDMKSIFHHSQFIKEEQGTGVQDKSNKMVLYEGKFQRLLDNWNSLEETRKKEHELLKKQIAKSPKLQQLMTRPETIQEIHQKHPEALDVINSVNHQKEREKQLYFQIHAKSYLKKWNSTYFPLSFKDRLGQNKRIEYTTNTKPFRTTTETAQPEDEFNQTRRAWKL